MEPLKVRFGLWEFDAGRRQLLEDGRPVALTGKAFELLWLLLERRPRVVTKQEINDRLWPATFVSEVNLSRLVFELRAALRDDARQPSLLRTVRGVGYAFAGAAVAAAHGRAEASCCRLLIGDREVELKEGRNVIGRSREADVPVVATSVSRRHAVITVSGERATIEDLGSKNGTRCGGRPVTAPVPLQDGTPIRVGGVEATFRVVAPEATTTGDDPGT